MPRPVTKQDHRCGKCFKKIKEGDHVIPILVVREIIATGADIHEPPRNIPGAVHVDCEYPDITTNPKYEETKEDAYV